MEQHKINNLHSYVKHEKFLNAVQYKLFSFFVYFRQFRLSGKFDDDFLWQGYLINCFYSCMQGVSESDAVL